MTKMSKYKEIHFKNTRIDVVSHGFTNRLEKCVRISFTDGLVETVYINTQFFSFNIENTNTEAVAIEDGRNYQLETLIISRTKLSRIPKRINQLKKITYLEITGNSIEFVALDDFDGLNNLETLSLSRNSIKFIHSYATVSLPKLFIFKIHNNKLQQLDVCGWIMPSINMLELHRNNLTHFAIGHFSTLSYVTLQYNPLNCAWRDSVLELDINKYMPLMIKFSCDVNIPGNFSLHCPSSLDDLRQQNSNLQLELNQLREYASSNQRLNQLQEQTSEIKDRLIRLEVALQKVDSRTIEQQNVASDIVEAMYRMEIERVYKPTEAE